MRPCLVACACLSVICLLHVPSAYGQSEGDWEAPPEADTLTNPYEVTEAFVQSGQKTYVLMCRMCHGESGEGSGPAATALAVPPADFTSESVQAQSDGALFWKLTTGNPPMAAYGEILSKKERWALVAYIRHLGEVDDEE